MPRKRQFHTVRGYQRQEHGLLTDSMEDYLEMIYRHCIDADFTRINVLAEQLNVQASSATKMVQKLAELGLVEYEKYGLVYLTTAGREQGQFLFHRHQVVEQFLAYLGVGEEDLLRETELVEHNISPSTVRKLELLNEFFGANPDLQRRLRAFIIEQE
ncbi:MAG: DtxR family transcriptional regulator [Firmicutes bacterium]|nr:DtxR family transcriptional regulator [Bacillota bacterium]